MDSRDVDSGRLDRDVPGDRTSLVRDPALEPGTLNGPTIVAAEQSTDPLAEFASEAENLTTARPTREDEVRSVPPRNDLSSNLLRPEVQRGARRDESPARYTDLDPDLPLNLATPQAYAGYPAIARHADRSWAAVAMIGVGLAVFGSGAYLYSTYPSWLSADERSQASVAQPRSDQPASQVPVTDGEVEPEARGEPAAPEPAQVVATAEAVDAAAVQSEAATPRNPAALPPNSDAAGSTHDDPSAPTARVPRRTAEAPSVAGEWSMNTRVESSRLQRYEGLRLAYYLRLQQVGTQVIGTGYKLRENDRAVGIQTPITLSGEVAGDRVVLSFQERGTHRPSAGKLVLNRESDDVLRGRFSSDAAESSGVVEARR